MASCAPGSGPDLAGRHLTSSDLSSYSSDFPCANLTGADLSGLSLAQVDFTGAVMRDANLQQADLTQATLDQADLPGANRSNATMTQVSARHAKLVSAELAHADLTQADLTGADLAKANLSGTTFTQSTLDQANFAGATGVPPYSLYLLIVAGVILTLLILGSIGKSSRILRLNGENMSNFAMSRTGIALTRGLAGSLVVALGFHLFLGGLIDEIASASGPPVAQTCSAGALCTVGVAADSSAFSAAFSSSSRASPYGASVTRRPAMPACLAGQWAQAPCSADSLAHGSAGRLVPGRRVPLTQCPADQMTREPLVLSLNPRAP